jgi:hypothetical protein
VLDQIDHFQHRVFQGRGHVATATGA